MGQRATIVEMAGGLDLATPAIAKAPGSLIACQNYESDEQGYRRVDGYERFDGQARPSAASTAQLAFENGDTEPSIDDLIEGASSGAYGWLMEIEVTSGTWGGSDAAGTMILRHVSGTFSDGEDLEVSSSAFADCSGTQNPAWATSDVEEAAYIATAAEAARDLIDAVPGSGPVRGVWTLNGETFAVRDNGGATAAVIHKATASGWQAVTLGHIIEFTAGDATSGTVGFFSGDTITGGSSGATATVDRVIKTTGAWDATGEGFLVLSGITGTFSAETITGPTGTASAAGAQTQITINPGGKYRTITKNFYGAAETTRIYGVSGVDRAFEFDGTSYVPIRTGLPDALDKPAHVGEIAKHLFLAVGSSLLNSSIGEPVEFDVNSGAGEIAFGHDVTAMESGFLGALIVAGTDRISYITGTSASDFQLADIAPDTGAITDTMAIIGTPYFLDDKGVRSLKSAQTFGNWRMGTETDKVQSLIRAKLKAGITPVGAVRVRAKDTYRLFFADRSGISVYFGRKNTESMPFALGFTPYVLTGGVDSDGVETIFAGGEDGFVYQIDSGNSFDGEAVDAFLLLAYMNMGYPTQLKRYHRADPEVSGGAAGAGISVVGNFAYGNTNLVALSDAITMPGRGGYWDVASWDDFYWDAGVLNDQPIEVNGIGENIALGFISEHTHEDPHVISSITLYWSPRKAKR